MAYGYDAYGGGWPQFNGGFMGLGGYGGGYQQFAPQMQALPQWFNQGVQEQQQLGNQQGRMANMQGRLGDLQQQWGAAGTQDQPGLQNRMDAVQGRITGLQGRMGDPNATGANRAGMGWRQTRRQAQQPAGAQSQQAVGAMTPQMPGAGFGNSGYAGSGYNPSAAAGSPVMSLGTGNFNTGFGELTPMSGGNANVFKRQGAGEDDGLFYNQGGQWNQMSMDQYRANPNETYQAPDVNSQGAVKQDFFRLGQDPAFLNRQQGAYNPNVRRGGGRVGGY